MEKAGNGVQFPARCDSENMEAATAMLPGKVYTYTATKKIGEVLDLVYRVAVSILKYISFIEHQGKGQEGLVGGEDGTEENWWWACCRNKLCPHIATTGHAAGAVCPPQQPS